MMTPTTAPLIFPIPPLKEIPNDTRGDRVKLIALTGSRRGVRPESFKECPRAVEDSRHDEDAHRDLENGDSTDTCGFGVSADGVHVLAKDCFIPDEPCDEDREEGGYDEFWERHILTADLTQNPPASDRILDVAVDRSDGSPAGSEEEKPVDD